ncbi:MAG: FAD binding domain-containing protein [Acidobacteria bacterium]|nr:FAD binding domain-containing protein [Acidobacteriota bacterium]
MSMPAFRLERPRSVAGAVSILAAHGPDAMILAGGTDVVPNLQMKLFSPRVLVDIKSLAKVCRLSAIEWSPGNGLRIGALSTLTAVCESLLIQEKFPVLARAVATIAGPLQRNMGTLGGNLCLETRCHWYNQSEFWRKSLGGCLKLQVSDALAGKEGPVCHVAPGGRRCWAAWSGDAAPALLTLDAEIEIAGPAGLRRVALAQFYRNDGMDRIALGRDELLTAVRVPPRMAGRRGNYRKLRVRNSIDYPLAGVAVSMDVDPRGVCRDARLALTAVNPAPLLVKEVGEWLIGQTASPELIERVAQQAIRTAKPLTTSGSTPVYRRDMVRVFTRRALEEAWRETAGAPV